MYDKRSNNVLNGTCYKKSIEKSYPNPVPLFPGFVEKFLPGDLYSLPGLDAGLNAPIGPPNVP